LEPPNPLRKHDLLCELWAFAEQVLSALGVVEIRAQQHCHKTAAGFRECQSMLYEPHSRRVGRVGYNAVRLARGEIEKVLIARNVTTRNSDAPFFQGCHHLAATARRLPKMPDFLREVIAQDMRHPRWRFVLVEFLFERSRYLAGS